MPEINEHSRAMWAAYSDEPVEERLIRMEEER